MKLAMRGEISDSELRFFPAPNTFPNDETSKLCAERHAGATTMKVSEKGPCVLIFLPGIDEDVQNNLAFAKLASALCKEGVSVVGLEPPGCGRSAGPRGELPTSAALLADLTSAVMEILRWEMEWAGGSSQVSFLLAGHSMGGCLSVLLADHFAAPEQKTLVPESKFLGAVLLAPAVDTLVDPAFACCTCGCCGCCCGGRHGCSMLAPMWCGIQSLFQCLVLSCGWTSLLPTETDIEVKYPAMPEDEKQALRKSLCVERMTASGVFSLLQLMRTLQAHHWEPPPSPPPLFILQGTRDWAVPPESVRAFASRRGVHQVRAGDWNSAKSAQEVIMKLSDNVAPAPYVLLEVPGASHHVLGGGVPWGGGKDVALDVALPLISRWVLRRCADA